MRLPGFHFVHDVQSMDSAAAAQMVNEISSCRGLVDTPAPEGWAAQRF
jgi:hypothetical protein